MFGAEKLDLGLTFEELDNVDLLFALTPRQLESVALMALGLSVKEVAERMHCASRTVESHMHGAFERTGLDRLQLLRLLLLSPNLPLPLVRTDYKSSAGVGGDLAATTSQMLLNTVATLRKIAILIGEGACEQDSNGYGKD